LSARSNGVTVDYEPIVFYVLDSHICLSARSQAIHCHAGLPNARVRRSSFLLCIRSAFGLAVARLRSDMTTSIRHLHPVLGECLRRSQLLSKVIGLDAVKLKKQVCRSATLIVLAIILASSMGFAQLSIENPKHGSVPEEQARLLLRLSCRAIAHQLHLRESSISEMEMHLVLGEKDEGFGYDEHMVPTLFLREWDEKKFVTAALRFAVQRSIDQHQEAQ